MDALGIVASLFFVAYLIYWSLKNDTVRTITAQVGFLRMRNPETEKKTKAQQTPITAESEPSDAERDAPEEAGDGEARSLLSRLKRGEQDRP